MTAMERAEYDAAILGLREALDERDLATAWPEGRALPPEAAVAAAVEAPTGAGSQPGP
jgi:hypothetical protein